jgi:hypothetical protein
MDIGVKDVNKFLSFNIFSIGNKGGEQLEKRVVKRKIEDSETKQPETKQETKQTAGVFGFLTLDLASIDIGRTYEVLKSKIKLGKDRLDPDVLSEAIDEAPEWAFKAAQLHIIAKEKLSKFEDITFKLKYAELANDATDELEALKRKGKLSGQVSKDKVENWIILNKPEYADLLEQKRELELAVEAFESLSRQFESKKSLLQTQGRILEKKNVIVSGGRN